MEQLECRFYGREEIADITGLDVHSHNFAAQVREKLTSWGYTHEYKPRQGVEITKVPETPLERMAELMQREFHIDGQVDPYSFTCFIAALHHIEHFTDMPWDKRVQMMRRCFNIEVAPRTLQNWMRKLIAVEYVQKNYKGTVLWHTYYKDGIKIQELFDEDSPIYAAYKARLSELLEKHPKDTPFGKVYGEAVRTLFSEFGCLYRPKGVTYYTWGFDSNNIKDPVLEILGDLFPICQGKYIFPQPIKREDSHTHDSHTEHSPKKDSPL